jgi:hypothetical protein
MQFGEPMTFSMSAEITFLMGEFSNSVVSFVEVGMNVGGKFLILFYRLFMKTVQRVQNFVKLHVN